MSEPRRLNRRAAVLVAVGLLALCGCNDSSVTVGPASSTTGSSTASSTPPSSTPASTAPSTTPTSTASSSTASSTTSSASRSQPTSLDDQLKGTTAVDPSDYKGLVTDVGFQSPSGNIACGFTTTPSARIVCQIESFAFTSPAGNCNGGGDGGAIVFEPGAKPSFACLGDLESGGPTLNYGSRITVGGLTCASQTSGVTCVGVTPHGFLLAKERYTLS